MRPYYRSGGIALYQGDSLAVLRSLPREAVQMCVTSPPYWGLRDYGVPGQLGLEAAPEEYVAKLVGIFRELRRVLRDDGTLWLNLGDCYATGGGKAISPGGGAQGDRWAGRGMNTKQPKWAAALGPICQPNRMPVPGLKPKDLAGMPWRVAFALQADGWYLRSDIVWHKPNPMPESVTDRPTKAHEYLFLLAKSERYYYDAGAIKEPTKADTAARYARGRSDHHKWADGGPGGQTIATNRPGSLFARSGNKERKTADGTAEPSGPSRRGHLRALTSRRSRRSSLSRAFALARGQATSCSTRSTGQEPAAWSRYRKAEGTSGSN